MINFSGVWVLNLGKSKLQSPPPESSVFKISHKEQSFLLDRTHIINGVPDRFTIELIIDGMAIKKDHNGINIISKMYWDNDSLVCDMIFRQGNEGADNIVKYSLADKGRTLVAEELFTSGEHKHHNIWVFDRNETGTSGV